LVDIVLPQVTPHGISLAGMVHIRRPTVPIIFVTGYAQHSRDLPIGSRLLLKPFSPQELLDAVPTALASPPPRPVNA
jgi:CheY-like chemotaxis protein